MASVKIGRVRVPITAIARQGLAMAYVAAERDQRAQEQAEHLGRMMAEREKRLRGKPPVAQRCPVCLGPKEPHDPTCCASRTARGR